MDELESLDKIKEAEAKATQTVERAKQTKARILEDAKKEAVQIVEKTLEKAKHEREKWLEVSRNKIEIEKSSKLKAHQKKIEALKEIPSSEKFKSEVDRLAEKFLEMV